jgi:hypothetical protein
LLVRPFPFVSTALSYCGVFCDFFRALSRRRASCTIATPWCDAFDSTVALACCGKSAGNKKAAAIGPRRAID